jgi:selenide,water dikinase
MSATLFDDHRPRGAIAGDVIVLTKPLGTQVAGNVKQWMTREGKWPTVADKISIDEGNRAYHKAMRQMARLNRTAARCMHKYGNIKSSYGSTW